LHWELYIYIKKYIVFSDAEGKATELQGARRGEERRGEGRDGGCEEEQKGEVGDDV
jgi:hypothetical protein